MTRYSSLTSEAKVYYTWMFSFDNNPCASETKDTLVSCTEHGQSNFLSGTLRVFAKTLHFVIVDKRSMPLRKEYSTGLTSAGESLEYIPFSCRHSYISIARTR
jgi:hypothetical protein